MSQIKRKNSIKKKTSGEIYIEGTRFKIQDSNKTNTIELLKMILDKYN